MLERIMNAGTGVYILWGIALLGLVFKLIINTYLRGLIKASEQMETTNRQKLRTIKQKFKNGRSFGLNNGNAEAFTDKNIRAMRFLGINLEQWRKSGRLFACVVCMILAGSFLYYDTHWVGSQGMVELFANGVIICAFLGALENIFLVNNKMEILKANISCYLDNLTPDISVKEGPIKIRAENPPASEAVQVEPINESAVSSEALNGFLKEFFS